MPQQTARPPLFPAGWLVEHDYTDETLGLLRAGKESEVYLVARSGNGRVSYLAEKRFKPRARRSFRDDALYRGGWVIGDRRVARAIRRGTRRGKEFIEGMWSESEWRNLVHLARAGASVPPPVEPCELGYRMAFVGENGHAAPRLSDVALDGREARALYRQLLDEVAVMLSAGRVHGDLSAYNVLYWHGRGVLIDFSQTVDVITHPAARDLLRRDVERVVWHFHRRGIQDEVERALREVGDDPRIYGAAGW
jgi:RIO kinase 1